MMKLMEYLLKGFIGAMVIVVGLGAFFGAGSLIEKWFGYYASLVFWGLMLSALFGYEIYRIDKRGNEDE